jgi:hypothetical protein
MDLVLRDDGLFAESIFSKIPENLRNHFSVKYWKTRKESNFKANIELAELKPCCKSTFRETYSSIDLSEAAQDYYKLCELAEDCANRCRVMAALHSTPELKLLEVIDIARAYDLEPPMKLDTMPIVLRLTDSRWWRRNLRKKYQRKFEHLAICGGIVKKNHEVYCSDYAVDMWLSQQARNRKLLESLAVINQHDEAFTLAELSDLSVSNPAIRRAELMTRIRGHEDYARTQGKAAVFLTLTAPSKYHPTSKKYSGADPRETQEYLTTIWSQIRASLARKNLKFSGVRVAEPHHDGAPHWHMLLFMNPKEQKAIVGECRKYALMQDGNERGAQKHRFTVEFIDYRKGSAVSYIAKYISKNIDGHGVDIDLETGEAVSATINRVAAWASCWGIRQFQLIGTAPVSIWREMRRILSSDDDLETEPTAELARRAADNGDFAVFEAAYIRANEKGVPFKLIKEFTGEINDFGEMKAAEVKGVQSGLWQVITRTFVWEIAAKIGGTWTRVNNCTQSVIFKNKPENIPIPST